METCSKMEWETQLALNWHLLGALVLQCGSAEVVFTALSLHNFWKTVLLSFPTSPVYKTVGLTESHCIVLRNYVRKGLFLLCLVLSLKEC